MNQSLIQKLDVLSNFFDIEQVARTTVDQKYISEYYRVNKLAYSLLHTKEHFVHMGLTKKGDEYGEEDLYAHAKEIHQLIKNTGASHVLELATGRGGNSAWLAKRNPDVSFAGLDISATQLAFAKRISSGIDNFKVQQGSFEDLSCFADESFDLVFIVEALCHSSNLEKVLIEVTRVLKRGGKFLVYDGFRQIRVGDLNVEELQLMRLLEVGVAVEHFTEINVFLHAAQNAGFHVDTNKDLSLLVLPTMKRFERKAETFFKLGLVAKLLLGIFPEKFSLNIVSGYLFRALIESGHFSYRLTIFSKV